MQGQGTASEKQSQGQEIWHFPVEFKEECSIHSSSIETMLSVSGDTYNLMSKTIERVARTIGHQQKGIKESVKRRYLIVLGKFRLQVVNTKMLV